jgi:hypothetical protein
MALASREFQLFSLKFLAHIGNFLVLFRGLELSDREFILWLFFLIICYDDYLLYWLFIPTMKSPKIQQINKPKHQHNQTKKSLQQPIPYAPKTEITASK